MADTESPSCPNCKRLEARIQALEAENARHQDRIARLEKNSSNSSKPPSSDIVAPLRGKKRPSSKRRRRRGGQRGHAGMTRVPFPPERVDHRRTLSPDACPRCDTHLGGRPVVSTKTFQQAELPDHPVAVTEYTSRGRWCPCCKRIVHAPQVPGLFGPNLAALIAWLKGAMHGSYTSIGEFFADVLDLPVSRGTLAAAIQRTSAALAPAYAEAAARLPEQPLVHIDETGHKEEGRNPWTWCFGNARMALFAIRDSRGSQVVEEMLGAAFEGLAVHDFYSAYIKYDASNRQFCLAHLIRDVKFLGTLTDRRERRWGAKVLEDFKELFALYHRREELTARAYVRKAKALKHRIRKRTWNASALPSNARNLAKRIRTHFEDIFRFLEDAQAPPTNNLAERLLRPVVIDRRITQGTRGARGRRWCERIWTTLATCRLQGRSAWQFLRDAIESFYARAASPSLLPA